MMETTLMRRLARVGFWVCLGSFVMSLVLAPIMPLILLRAATFAEKFSCGSQFGAAALAAAFGVFFFKKRAYDPLIGTIFVAICIASMELLTESIIFNSVGGYPGDDSTGLEIGLFAGGVVLLLVPALIGVFLVVKLRSELATGIAETVYTRYTDALER